MLIWKELSAVQKEIRLILICKEDFCVCTPQMNGEGII
jgi:hypothetical protein